MRIVCPHCDTSYEVTAESLGEAGRSVRCARCGTTWFAQAPAPELVVGFRWIDAAPPEPEIVSRPVEAPLSADAADDMTAAPDGGAASPPADQEPPADALPLVPAADAGIVEIPAPRPLPEDVETAAARRARLAGEAARRRWWPPNVPLVILGLTALVAALIAWRSDVVRLAPQTAALFARIGLPVNLRGLVFADVKTSGETHEGVPVLVIAGQIANVTKGPVEVPRLRFALRNPAGVEVYAWTALPARTVLPAGEELPFRTRLASPPADTRDVQVRFFNRRDLEAIR